MIQENIQQKEKSVKVKDIFFLKGKAKEEKVEQVDLYGDSSGEVRMCQRLVLEEPMPMVENKWLRNNLFCSIGPVNGQDYTMVIDGGSSDNIVSLAPINHVKRPQPCFV